MQLPHQGSSQTRRLLRTCGGACAEAEERVVTLGLLLLALCNPRRSGGGRRGLAAAPPARGNSWALRGNSCGCTAAGGFGYMAARHSPHTMNHELLRAVSTGNADLLAQALGIWSTTTVEQADSSCLESVTADGSSALHIAASHGYLELVVMICTQNISLINSRNNLLDTPLICSARAGHANVVRYLAERALAEQEAEDPVLRARNLDGETAMHEAVRNGHVLVLQKLMSMDNGLAAVVDGKGVSPLYLAVLSDRPDMVDVLIRESLDGVRSTVTVSYSGPDGQTALHAAVYVRKEISESLLRWEPMLAGKVDSYGRTALHYAALACGTGPPLKLLLKNSSLAYIPDNDGLFPVHVAAIAGKADVIRELMEICPNCDELYDKKRRNILHCAVEYKRVKVVWHTFRNPNFSRMMNARDIEGNTPLHLAVKYGHLMIFALLVWDSRVNLSIMNNEGLTPLDVAFSNRHSDHTFHFTSTSIITWLTLCEASGGPCHQARNLTDKGCLEDKELRNYTVVFNIITLISLLMATGSFAAPFIAPLGYIAELEDAFMPVFRGRSGFWIFIIANTMSLVLSTVATCVHANKTTISMRCRLFYLTSAAGLVFGAAMFMLITFTNRWEEYILFWLVSNFAVPLCSWVATSNRPWQNISKVIAAAVLVAMVRSFIITGQLLFKGYCLVNMKPAVGLGARYKVMQTLYTPVEIWPL